jgi:hypothetical protein
VIDPVTISFATPSGRTTRVHTPASRRLLVHYPLRRVKVNVQEPQVWSTAHWLVSLAAYKRRGPRGAPSTTAAQLTLTTLLGASTSRPEPFASSERGVVLG